MPARQEDFLFAEHVLRRGFATEEQVQECLQLLERLRDEMQLEESLGALLVKKGYLAPAQAAVVQQTASPGMAGATRNQIEGYRLIARLGAGAMGSVYKAHHLKLDLPVALKVLRVDLAASRTQVERLKREAQLAARLNHPNIVRGLDVGESNGFHYFAMEYVDGVTVREFLRKRPLREKEALRIVRDVARALDHAHGQGVIHRDVKPGNIMLTRDGAVKLADFGLARGQAPSDLTLEHASIGTPQYLAPEQARRGADATARSDLFGLGASLYHLVTGQPPFSGENLGEIFQQVLRCQFAPPESLVPDLHLDTVYVIHRLMRANPRERYASAQALLKDLEAIERGERIAPPEFKGDYRAFLARKRARRIAAGTAASVLVVVAAVVAAVWVGRAREEDARRQQCRAADVFYSGSLDTLERVADLEAAEHALVRAFHGAAAHCNEEELSGLRLRKERVEGERRILEAAEALRAKSAEDAAGFRAIVQDLEGARPTLPGVRRRLEAITEEVREASLRAARGHERRVYGQETVFPGAAAAEEELEALAHALRERYLEFPELPPGTPAGHAAVLRTLRESVEKSEGEYADKWAASLKEEDFPGARRTLDYLLQDRTKARQKAQAQELPEKFLAYFPEQDDRDRQLREAEEQAWKLVSGSAELKRAAQRPDEELAELLAFLPKASLTRSLVERGVAEARVRMEAEVARQAALVETFERQARRRAGERLYLECYEQIAAAEGTRWIGEPARRIGFLRAWGDALRRVAERFWQNVPRREIQVGPEGARQRVPGSAVSRDGDEMLFDGGRGKEPVRATLRDLDRQQLFDILGFIESERPDLEMRWAFHAAEAFGEARPQLALRQFKEAASFAGKAGGGWAPELERELARLQAQMVEQEKGAADLLVLMEQARSAQRYDVAYTYCVRLLSAKGFGYTDIVQNAQNNAMLVGLLVELRRLVGTDRRQIRSGVPKENFLLSEKTGALSVTYDFSEWSPDKPPPGVDPREWLPPRLRQFWKERYDQWRDDAIAWGEWFGTQPWAADFELFLRRATLQLLDWGEGAEVVDGELRMPLKSSKEGASQGGPKSDADLQTEAKERAYANHWAWYQRREADLVILRLRNPCLPTQDWGLEFTIAWNDEPAVYFAVAAGELQAGVVSLKGRLNGGGYGTRLFQQESMVEGLDGKIFAEFHEHLRKDPKRRKLRGDASEATFEGAGPYRVRLERKGSELRFFFLPLQKWREAGGFSDKEPVASLRLPRTKLELGVSLPVEGQVFRFLSLVGCRIDDVQVTGFVEVQDAPLERGQ
ncbi:MAG: protein kinase domain-containing protein [Planctomycetaceae bacterium]